MVAGGETQCPAGGLAQIADDALALCNLGNNAPAAGEQGVAGFGQADAFTDAVEQRDTERMLERLYPFADSGLGQEQGIRSAGERARIADGEKCLNALDIHVVEVVLLR